VSPENNRIGRTPIRRYGRRLRVGAVVFFVLLVIAVGSALELLIANERKARFEEESRHAINLSRAFEEHTARTLDYVDEVLLQLVRRMESDAPTADLGGLYDGLNSKIIIGLGLTDAEGLTTASYPNRAARFSVADRPHFRAHRDADTKRLYLGLPTLSRPSGIWSLFATRRANRPDGSFLGVGGLAIDPAYFIEFYRELDLGPASVVALVGHDGFVRARLPRHEGDDPIDLSSTRAFQRILASPPGGVDLVEASTTDRIPRIWAYRHVRGYPLIVTIGVATDHVLKETERRATRYRWVAGGAILLIGCILAGLLSLHRRWEIAEARGRADAALRQSFIESSAVVTWMKDEAGRYVFVSDNFQKYYRVDRASIIGRTDDEVWPAESAERFRRTDEDMLAGRALGEYLDRVVLADGDVSWWIKQKFRYVDADGRRLIAGLGIDVTARIEAEQKLKANETLLEAIVNSSPDWIYVKDLDHRYLMVNAAMATAHGKSQGELIGRTDEALWSAGPRTERASDQLRDIHEADRAAFRGEIVRRPNQERVLVSGVRRWVDTIKVPYRDAGRRIIGLVGYSRDVTERVTAEASIRLFSTIVEQSPVSVMVTDTDGAIEYVNPAFTAITGYAAAEVRGHNPRLFKSGHTPPETYRALWTTLMRGEPWRGEFLNRVKSGAAIWERVAIAPLKDGAGRVTHFVAVKENITHDKAIQADLIEAKDRALAANRAKSTFLAMMSHELRTPLNAIIGFSEMLRLQKHGPLGAERYQEYAADIEGSGRHLLELLNEVLDLAKLETGRFQLDLRLQSLAGIVKKLASVLSTMAGEAGHRLVLRLDEAGDGLCDARAVRQVLLNLVGNAIKYTRRGGVIEVRVVALPDRRVGLVVVDNGIGMAQADIEKATELFTRLDHRLDKLPEGVGIGLYMVKRLAENMKATLDIKSAPGAGTTVTVGFQAAEATEQAVAEVAT